MTRTGQLRIGCGKPGSVSARHRVGALLAVLLAGILLVVDLPLVHDHDEPGLYNEACALDRLAAGVRGAPAPEATPGPGPPPASETLSATTWIEPRLSPVVAGTPRAPPASRRLSV
jgi:hypothetical protein